MCSERFSHPTGLLLLTLAIDRVITDAIRGGDTCIAVLTARREYPECVSGDCSAIMRGLTREIVIVQGLGLVDEVKCALVALARKCSMIVHVLKLMGVRANS